MITLSCSTGALQNMVFGISEKLEMHLLDQPESGMGYQVLVTDSGNFAVLFASLAFNLDANGEPLEKDLEFACKSVSLESEGTQTGLSRVHGEAVQVSENSGRYLSAPDTEGDVPVSNQGSQASIREDVDATKHAAIETMGDSIRKMTGVGILDRDEDGSLLSRGENPTDAVQRLSFKVLTRNSYLSTTKAGEVFVRYSAVVADRRIRADGSVRAGTYVTTMADEKVVPSGLAAIARYALPNWRPAIFKRLLAPGTGVPIRCGTSAPKFGQAGGGVEVMFPGSTRNGTDLGYTQILEK